MSTLPRQKATLQKCGDPNAAMKKHQGITPFKWTIMLGDDPFGYYVTKADAQAEARKFNLVL